ncbi:MAG: tetratricopeptide repeat protein, partial [Cyanobacteria bacterium J06621_11]
SEQGDYDRAIADYDKAIEINPDYVSAYFSRGIAWSKQEDYGRAIADYDKAIEIDNESAQAYDYRGRSWFGKGEYSMAIADFEKAISFGREDAKMYDLMAFASLQIGEDAEKVKRLFQRSADLYRQQGNIDQYLEILEHGVKSSDQLYKNSR